MNKFSVVAVAALLMVSCGSSDADSNSSNPSGDRVPETAAPATAAGLDVLCDRLTGVTAELAGVEPGSTSGYRELDHLSECISAFMDGDFEGSVAPDASTQEEMMSLRSSCSGAEGTIGKASLVYYCESVPGNPRALLFFDLYDTQYVFGAGHRLDTGFVTFTSMVSALGKLLDTADTGDCCVVTESAHETSGCAALDGYANQFTSAPVSPGAVSEALTAAAGQLPAIGTELEQLAAFWAQVAADNPNPLTPNEVDSLSAQIAATPGLLEAVRAFNDFALQVC